jgi:hypothetical protein
MELDEKRKITDLTLFEKRELVQVHQSNPNWTQQMIANDFNKRHKGKEVKRNTISQILKNSTRILEAGDSLKDMKREKAPVYPELESALLTWFK